MAIPKTVYIDEADEAVWERAEELSSESMSQLVSRLLKEEVARMVKLQEYGEGSEHIMIDVSVLGEGSDYDTKRVAFNGRWIVEGVSGYNVALTDDGRLLTYFDAEGFMLHQIYESSDELQGDADVPEDVKEAVAEALGEDCIEYLSV